MKAKSTFISKGFKIISWSRCGFRGEGVARLRPSFFLQSIVLCNHYVELQTESFEVKLIVSNAPLTYIYPSTIGTCLTTNHLLFGRQLFCSSKTTSTLVRNLTVLSNTTDKINRISNNFWDRRRHEYVVNLRETNETSKLNINFPKLMLMIMCQFMIKRCPDTFGELP